MQLTDYFLLFGSVMIGGIGYFIIKNPGPNFLKLILSFSGAFLFALTVLHLMPEVYQHNSASIGVWIMIGFFLQIIMEFFSEGIEHGHMHIHHDHKGTFPTTMMLSLCLHSLLEGMPLAGKLSNGLNDRSLLIGIILHHLPVAFALVSMLVASGISKTKVITYLALFAIMAPLGAFSSNFIGGNMLADYSGWFDKMMAIVIGIFLHISTTILFESSSNHRFNLYKMIAIITGGLIGVFVS